MTVTYLFIILIDDYKFLSCYRNDRQGGGVGLYLKDNINFNRLSDLEINDDEICQSIFVEIKFDKSSTIFGWPLGLQ